VKKEIKSILGVFPAQQYGQNEEKINQSGNLKILLKKYKNNPETVVFLMVP
jgi:hypothetical protein